jgi:hypothetical protein
MLSIVFQFVALLASLVQSATTMPLRTGEVARQLTEQDVAALELVLPSGEKPWLLNGDRAQFGNAQFVQAFLPATVSTAVLRRGTVINVERRNSRSGLERPKSDDAWVVQGTESYAQVAIAGRNFDQIQGDQDINRPFRTVGRFDDSELVRLIESLRSESTLTDRDLSSIQTWPILSVTRKMDDTVEVMLRGAVMQGQVIMLRQAGENWTVVVIGVWAA